MSGTGARTRQATRHLLESGFWKPENLRVLAAARSRDRAEPDGRDPLPHLEATAGWLAAAQDATGDGGVSWGYRLRTGWAPSYPETTGYIIPTFLAISEALGDPGYRDRAERAVAFLAGLQADDGSFPGGRLDAPVPAPSVFNSGQIVCGLTGWYRDSRDERVLDMARRATDWLIRVQDDDGAWRRHGYGGYPVTYTAHVSCWMAELGVLIGERRYLAAAGRHLDWVLRQQDPESGWFARSGFSEADHSAGRSVSHTLAYTLWGVLHGGTLLERSDAIAAIQRPARALAELVVAGGWLPGVIDSGWNGQAAYACLTGNAQMTLLWDRLTEEEPDPLLRAAADRSLGLVGRAQSVDTGRPGIRGGIPGSDPIWGAYIRYALPNWAAKFYADALIARRVGVRSLAP